MQTRFGPQSALLRQSPQVPERRQTVAPSTVMSQAQKALPLQVFPAPARHRDWPTAQVP
jgi:hypothetical protein